MKAFTTRFKMADRNAEKSGLEFGQFEGKASWP